MPHFITATLLIALLTPLPAHATTYRHYQNREIVVEADLLVAGKIVAIFEPPIGADEEKTGCSVAVVKVSRVYKGDVKAGAEVSFVFCSHLSSKAIQILMRGPDQYEVGEELMLPLRDRGDRFNGYILPKEAAQAKWRVWSPRGIYDKQIQSAEFRKVAEIWSEPDKHLDDAAQCADGAYFLAHQKRLPEKTLLKLLKSADSGKEYAGCLAAQIMKTNAALEPLVGLIEKHRSGYYDDPPNAGTSEKDREASWQTFDAARRALYETPINGERDGPALLRLVLAGEMSATLTERLLRSGPARWHVRKHWRETSDPDILASSLRVLHALDPRAAYEPIKSYVTHREDRYRFGWLLRTYQTAWTQRFAFERAHDLDGGHGVVEQYHIVRDCFRFTHGPVEQGDAKTWEKMYEELRKTAAVQLALTEKNGPSFAELPARLNALPLWESHRVGGSAFIQLNKDQQKELTKLLVQHADPKAKGLDANAEAMWLVDLYDPEYSRLPRGQLWVAEDGTFGFGWLPDRAWGKSGSIPAFLKKPPR